MILRALVLACVLAMGLAPVTAQMPGAMPPPGAPVVVLSPPEGFQPPEMPPAMPADPQAARQMMLDMFFKALAGPDGLIDRGEFQAWVREVHMPPPPGGGPMGPPPPECDFNRDGKVDRTEAEQCKRQMPPPGDMTGPMGPPPPECDFNRDGKVDQFEAEQCKKQMPPPECDFNRDGKVDQFEAEQCKKQMPPPGDMTGPMGPPPPEC
ncbi:MAG: hypothetical protein ABIL09_01965, partial [Gemmatimonadota bacterium]